ncbi:MAG: c-type cytochrome biogenesis protein CcsB [Candidatus Omnitrophica bacterium]|nr:c-type cytochrome biogenesis protein CcsB [Candidatus Omnitrophota bacterium]
MRFSLFELTLIFYFLSIIFYLLDIFKNKKIGDKILILGFIFNSLLIFERWRLAQRPPLANMYEAIVFFSWSVALAYLIFDLKFKLRFLGLFVGILLSLNFVFASFLDSEIYSLVPALRSNWLAIHVISYFLGYGLLTISFILSLFYLFSFNKLSLDILKKFDFWSYQLVSFGFLFLTIGLLTGAVWANVCWGSYWSWDPKETWALITWLIYLFYLHSRYLEGGKGKRSLYLNLLGFFSLLFTFFGVNFLLSGLHSY